MTAPQGGRVDITGTSFDIPDVAVKRTPAQVNLRTRSTITAALSLLDEPPLEFLTKAGREVTLADGMAELQGVLDLRLLDKLTVQDVEFDIAGTLRDVRSEVLVPGRVLSASALEVAIVDDMLSVAGAGRIGQVPFDGQFETDISPGATTSTVRGWIELSERFADEFGIGLPPGSVTGTGRADMEIDFEKGALGCFVSVRLWRASGCGCRNWTGPCRSAAPDGWRHRGGWGAALDRPAGDFGRGAERPRRCHLARQRTA